MFLHFHKLTTELFNSIKTQQINVFNASVDSNANCLCRALGAIKSARVQRPVLFNRGLCAAGQWFLWLRQPLKALGRRRYCACLPAQLCSACQWMSNSMLILKLGHYNSWGGMCAAEEIRVKRGHLLTSVAVTVMLCHMSVSRSSGLASVIFPSSTLMLNCLSRSVCRSMKYLQSHQKFEAKLFRNRRSISCRGFVVLCNRAASIRQTCRCVSFKTVGNQ